MLPVALVDDAVLRAIVGDLHPAVVRAVVDTVFEALHASSTATNIDALRAEQRTLDMRIARLVSAIEEGMAAAPLVEQLAMRQKERESLLRDIAAAEAVSTRVFDRAEIERKVLTEVARWREVLTEELPDGRQLLREILDEPLKFTPEGKAYRFEGNTRLGALVAGLVGATEVASPTGVEPVFRP